MGNQEELLLPVLNLIVQIPLVLALSLFFGIHLSLPFQVKNMSAPPLQNGVEKFILSGRNLIPSAFTLSKKSAIVNS